MATLDENLRWRQKIAGGAIASSQGNQFMHTRKYTRTFIGSDHAKKGAPAVWLAAVMAKCHKAILAYRGAHRNLSDLSALGLPSTFQSHTNSSLQVSFFFLVCLSEK